MSGWQIEHRMFCESLPACFTDYITGLDLALVLNFENARLEWKPVLIKWFAVK